jgi:hypothetical protein
LCGAKVTDVLVEDAPQRNRIKGVFISRTNGPDTLVKGRIVIDATGTGLVAALAGCKTRYGREARGEFNEPFGTETTDSKVQRCTWMYVSQRIRPGAVLPFEKLGKQNNNRSGAAEHHVDHWVGVKFKGVLDNYKERNTGIYLHWGATVECADTRDSVAIGKAMQEALALLGPDLAILHEHGYAVHLAPKLGIRECRRVEGEHIVTVNDLRSGKMPDDVIAVSDYGIDAWGEHIKKEDIACPRSGIPYRALIPLKTEGLLVVGKSISGTHLAASSYRVQPIVAAIGQASGTAAAMAVRLATHLRDLPVRQLQEDLKKQGVLL